MNKRGLVCFLTCDFLMRKSRCETQGHLFPKIVYETGESLSLQISPSDFLSSLLKL